MMNTSTVSLTSLVTTPGQSESQDLELNSSSSLTRKVTSHLKPDLDVQKQQKQLVKDLHLKRVQFLRKELDYLKATEWRYHPVNSGLKWLLTSSKTNDPEISDVIRCIEGEKDLRTIPEPTNLEDFKEFFYQNGTITDVQTEIVIIDEKYPFDITDIPFDNPKIGMKVQYLGFQRREEEEMQIRRILSLNDDQWDIQDEESNEEPIRMDSMVRIIVGKVQRREMRRVFLEQNNISFNLDEVSSEFIPYVGDWIKLEAVVVVDNNFSTVNHEVLQINRIKPLRSKLTNGSVTSYVPMSKYGTINNSIIFNKMSCEPGYNPVVGDKVVTDCIESSQGQHCWRALSVVPIIQQLATSQVPVQDTQSCTNLQSDNLADASREAKYCISVTTELNLNLQLLDEEDVVVEIKNTGPYKQILLKSCFLSKKAMSQLTLLRPNINTKTVLQPGETTTYVFRCHARFIGHSRESFLFIFRNFRVRRTFSIDVVMKIASNGNVDENANGNVKEKKLYVQHESDQSNYIPGIRPFQSPKFIAVRSGIFRIPQSLWDIVLRRQNGSQSYMETVVALEEAYSCLARELTIATYKDRFHVLLHLENIAASLAIQRYDINGTSMRPCAEFLSLEVPGLVEKRPSLLVGDKAIVSFPWDSSKDKLYEGFIHKVRSSEILLKFNPAFHEKYNGEQCNVTFKCSENAIRRSHTAVNLAIIHLGQEFLFPARVIAKTAQIDLQELSSPVESFEDVSKPWTSGMLTETNGTKLQTGESSTNSKTADAETYISQLKKRKLVWFNERLNIYQKEAVRNILQSPARPLPYVIFGPPGTGKTITLCETILQIFKTIPESRLLVATPSNSSANLITERLLDSGVLRPGDLVRLVGHHCISDDTIPEKLLPYCTIGDIAMEGSVNNSKNTNDGSRIATSSMSVLGRHRITVGTCVALGVLHIMGFPRGHFSHVLVDEAGQATEPEILIPLNFIHADHGHVILAGDPMQLGPVVESKLAQHFGLGVSFLSRLLQRFPYQRDMQGFERGYDTRLVTKLRMNYRSLPEILHLPDSLFYNSELEPQISMDSEEGKLLSLVASDLPEREEKGPPAIVFHGIVGKNYQDNDSPSWYNPEEAAQVYFYVLKLYNHGLSPDDIGIITPYHKQVRYIRDLLLETNLVLPKVASVEEFQGQERNVIIISAVRSVSDFVSQDIKHCLGFIASPQRLNVAITRARALLIILGNPHLLSQDSSWRSVIAYCIEHEAYTGCDFSLSSDQTTDFY